MSAFPSETRVRVRDDQATRLRAMLAQKAPESHLQPMHAEPAHVQSPPIIAIASGKGGVGKTFTSISLATALGALRKSVTLIDADFGAANTDIMLGLAPLRRLDECLMHGFSKGHELRDIAIDSRAGFELVPGPVGLGMSPASADRLRLIANVAHLRTKDTVILDCSAGVGAGVLDMTSQADMTLIVTTPEPTAIADAYALIKSLYRKCGPGIEASLALIVNQAGSRSEAERVHRRISGVASRFLGFEIVSMGAIPLDKSVGRSIRDQRVSRDGRLRSSSGRASKEIARTLLNALNGIQAQRDQAGAGLVCSPVPGGLRHARGR